MVRIRKDVRNVYDTLFDILYREFNESHESYDKLLEFLAVDSCPPIMLDIEGKLEWFFSNRQLSERLINAYNLPLIKSDRYDYLGDIYIDNVIGASEAGRKGLYLTPQPVVEAICKMTLGEVNNKEVNILEPCVGSGRFLLTANKYAPNANLYGVDKSLDMVRTSFTNAAIHNIRMYLLHADSLLHDIGHSEPEGIYNWQFANRWQSHYEKLKTIGSKPAELPKPLELPKTTELPKNFQYNLFKK